jgi:Undecaprenyl-phosphate galactose phosphotransferase WbaP
MTDVIDSERSLVNTRLRPIQLSVTTTLGADIAGAPDVPSPGFGFIQELLPAAETQSIPLSFAPGANNVVSPAHSPRSASTRSIPAAAFPLSRHLLTVAPVVAGDLFALACSALLGLLTVDALYTLHLSRLPIGVPQSFSWLCTLVMVPLIFAYWYRGLYPGVGLHPVIELCQAVKVNTTACLAVIAGLLISRSSPAWAIFFAVAWVASAVVVPLVRSQVRRLCSRFNWWGYPTMIISSGAAVRETIEALRHWPQCGLRPCGIIDPNGPAAGSVLGVPYLDARASHSAAYALIALPELNRVALAELVDVYHNSFPHLLVLSDSCSGQSLWRDARDCGSGLTGTELQNKLLLPWPRFVKRSMDVVLAGSALVLGLPLLAAVGLAVRLSSPGPVFFGHARLGRNGRRFKAWKFRTMRIDAEAVLQDLLACDPAARGEWERDHKLREDPRVTRIGNFLRRTSLDELPQFYNVLAGHMSLVGPRPIVSAEVDKYGNCYPLYSEVTPGITGLWQVSGRNNTTYDERVRFDSFYVRNWSPWLDLHILIRTVGVVVNGYGAC